MAATTTETTITQLAEDVGRLRRGLTPGSSLWHLADRLANGLETLYWTAAPCAAELIRQGADIQQALALVDLADRHLKRLLRDDLRDNYRCAQLAERRGLEEAA